MPITRELTSDELLDLEKQGIDSSLYKGKTLNLLTPDEVNQNKVAPKSEKIGVGSTIGRTLKSHAGEYVGGGAATLGGASLLTGLGLAPFTEGVSLVPSILGLLGIGAAGVGGSYAGGKAQEAIQGPDVTARLEQERQAAAEQNPITAKATDIIASGVAAGGKPNFSNIPKAGKALIGNVLDRDFLSMADRQAFSHVGREALSPAGGEAMAINSANQEALRKVAFSTVANPAISAGTSLVTTGRFPTIGQLGESALGGALFSEQNKLGRMANGVKEPSPEPLEKPFVNTTSIPELTPKTVEEQQPVIKIPTEQETVTKPSVTEKVPEVAKPAIEPALPKVETKEDLQKQLDEVQGESQTQPKLAPEVEKVEAKPIVKAEEESPSKIELAKPEEKTATPPTGIKAFRSTLDEIRALPHPRSEQVADSLHKTLDDRQLYFGQYGAHIQELARKLDYTPNDDRAVALALRYQRENKSAPPVSMLRTQAQRQVFNAIRGALDAVGEERLKLGEPVYRAGEPTMLQKDPHYFPTTPSPRISNMYRKGTDVNGIARMDRIFLAYQQSLGITPDMAVKSLHDWKQAMQGSSSRLDSLGNHQFYNAMRRAEGTPLPPEFTKDGALDNFISYMRRASMDMAYYKNVESNPEVMSALGETKDPWYRPIPADPQGGIAGNEAVQSQLKEIRGEVAGESYHNEQAFSGLATKAVLGLGTEVHKQISNQVGIISILDSPTTSALYLKGITLNRQKGLEHAIDNGILRVDAGSLVHDMLNPNNTLADKFRTIAKGIGKITTLNDVTDRLGTSLMQAGLESVMPYKIKMANGGDITTQKLLRNLDPDYRPGKVYDEQGFSRLASSAISRIQGTGDGRTMPKWMQGDNELSGFFRLSHWSISQTNRFFKDIWEPATRGEIKPLITSLFGSVVGGYMIKELREKLQGKSSQIPSLADVEASSRGVVGNAGPIAYNVMAALTYAGFGGMLSVFSKMPIDMAYKNQAQGMIFPLDEWASDTAKTISNMTTAAVNDPNFNWFHATQYAVAHELTSNFQMGRIIYNQMINNGMITGTLAEKKILTDKLNQLRRFDMVEGLPYNAIDESGNPYMNMEQKIFKVEQDPEKFAPMIVPLINNIMAAYSDKPDVMMSKLKALKQNQYTTFPSLEDTPISFMKYLSFLGNKEGKEAAMEALIDFEKHKMVNQAKSSVIP